MRHKIKGTLIFLYSSIIFGVIGTLFLIRDILSFVIEGSPSPTLVFTAGFPVLAVILYMFWKKSKTMEADPLKISLPVWVGFIFTWLGAAFTQVIITLGQKNEDLYPILIISIILIFLGAPLFIVGLINTIQPSRATENALKTIIKIITIIAVIIALLPVVALIAGTFMTGQYIVGIIISLFLIFFIWLFLYIFRKNKKNKLK